MAGQIAFWFEFGSTYSYLSAMRIEQMAADADVSVSWQPFLLGPIFQAQGWETSPFNLYPAKGRYMWQDMERLCAQRGLPLQRPNPFPQNGLTAARLILAAQAAGHETGRIAALVRAIFHAQFALGRDIASSDTLAECLAQTGLPVHVLDATQSETIKSRLRDQGTHAIDLDLFGAPSFVVGGALYWGDDRLEQALAAAAST